MGCFVEVCRRGSLKANACKSKVMVLGEEGLECEVCIDGIRLENVSEFNTWDASGTDEADCSSKMVSERGCRYY